MIVKSRPIMRGDALLALALLALSITACQKEHPEGPAVSKAFEELQVALFAGDGGAIWDRSVPELHREVAALRVKMAAVVGELDDYYSLEEATAIRRDIGAHLLEGAPDERSLFIAIGNMGTVTRDEEIDKGLKHDPPSIDGDEAFIETKAGEIYRFVKGKDGIWRSDLALVSFRAWPELATLTANLDRVSENIKHMKRQREVLRDPRTPEGAFNMLREALVGQNLDVLFTLVSPESRARLRAALDLYGKLPPGAQKGEIPGLTPALATALAKATDVRSLIGELVATDAVQEPLPIAAPDRVDHVERVGEGEALLTTTAGKQLRLERGSSDVWRFVALEDWARTALVEPLEKLGAPAPAPDGKKDQ